MKKMVCMLLAVVLMLGAFALPASAEKAAEEPAAGKIYKLPGGYVDFVGMGGGRIVCGKSMGTDEEGYPIVKYGAIDNTGKTVIPFEYDVATAPNDNGDFAVAKFDESKSSGMEWYILYGDGTSIAVYLRYRHDEYFDPYANFSVAYTQVLSNDYMLVLYMTGYDIPSYRMIIWDINSRENRYDTDVSINYDFPTLGIENVCVLKEGYAISRYFGQLLTILPNGYSGLSSYEIFSSNSYSESFGMLLSMDGYSDQVFDGFDFYSVYYYVYNRETLEVEGFYRYDTSTQTSEDLCEKFGFTPSEILNFSWQGDLNNWMLEPGKFGVGNVDGAYAYIDCINNVNTGFIFDYIFPDFSDGYFVAVKDGKFTYYKTDGTPTEQYFAENIYFSNGYSFVTNEAGETYVVDTNFDRVSENTVKLDETGEFAFHENGVLATYDGSYDFYVFAEDPDFSIYGDVSLDEKVDVADIMLLKNYIMNDEQSEDVLAVADLDDSGAADVGDIMLLKSLIMAG